MASSRIPPDLASALLQWVQSFDAASSIQSLKALSDGRILHEILQDIDHEYFIEALPSAAAETANHWIPRWQNLKYIDRNVRAYIRDVCGVLDSSTEQGVEGPYSADLKAIAQQDERRGEEETAVLLRMVLRAAMYSPESNERMGRVVLGLGPETAKVIATTLASMEESEPAGDESQEEQEREAKDDQDQFIAAGGQDISSSLTGKMDTELEQEERLIQAHRIIRQLEENNARAAADLDELRKDKVNLEEALDSLKYEAKSAGQQAKENDALRELRARADRDKDYIAEVEAELESTKTSMQSQQRQLERLKDDNDARQKLKDDLQVLKAERDDLLSKTRANDNLRKKIQTLQDQEKQNITLREDLRAAQDQLQSLETVRQQCDALRKANAENMNIIANTEQEIFDQKTSRKRLDHEFKVLQQKWEIARERQARDHETITDLEERLQKFDIEDATPATEQNGLEQELMAANGRRPSTARKLSRQISVSSPDLAIVEEKLRAITARNNKLESDYLDILQDKLGLETALADLRDPAKEPEENVPFLEQRKKLHAAQTDLTTLQDTMFATTAELASVKEKLLSIQSSRMANGTTKTIDLDSNAEYQALSRSYTELTRHSQEIEADLAEHKSLLRQALLSHAALLKEPEEVRKTTEYELLRRQLEEVRNADSDEIIVDVATNMAGRLEAERTETEATKATVKAHEATITALEAKLAATPVRPPAISDDDKRSMDLLQRENKLMASAWYDLSSRLQSNSVMVGKRRDEPKSWLGKQRALIGVGGGMR